MKTPEISIVMPAYNSSMFINESIESILMQTYTDFELIIIDDASTDHTVEIVRSYKDSRIQLILNKHDFIGSLNLGMTKAKGKYIARMDSDDIMVPDRLQLQYNFMEENPSIDISGGYLEAFGNENRILECPLEHIDILLTMIFYCPLNHPSVIMKKNMIYSFNKIHNIYQVYDKNYIYAEDYKLWTVLAEKKYKFGNISEILVNYRISDNQVTSQKWSEMRYCTYKIQNEYIEYIMQEIVNNNESLYDYISNTIKSYNTKNIDFIELKNTIHKIYADILGPIPS